VSNVYVGGVVEELSSLHFYTPATQIPPQHTATFFSKMQGTFEKRDTATHCNTLQHTANTLQHTATHCNTLQHAATHCNTLQRTTTHCTLTRQHTATHCNILHTLQHTATHCNTLLHSATPCNTLQHPATHCNDYSVLRDYSIRAVLLD